MITTGGPLPELSKTISVPSLDVTLLVVTAAFIAIFSLFSLVASLMRQGQDWRGYFGVQTAWPQGRDDAA
jgi:hypothetical protein